MASFLYTPYKNSLLVQAANVVDLDADNINASIVRSSTYTAQITDDFYNDVTTPVQEADAFLTISVIGFNVDATANIVFSSVPAGAAIDRLVIWKDTTVDSTSRLIALYDGFSITPNGGDITFIPHGSGLFDL